MSILRLRSMGAGSSHLARMRSLHRVAFPVWTRPATTGRSSQSGRATQEGRPTAAQCRAELFEVCEPALITSSPSRGRTWPAGLLEAAERSELIVLARRAPSTVHRIGQAFGLPCRDSGDPWGGIVIAGKIGQFCPAFITGCDYYS